MKKLLKKIKENWLGVIVGAALMYFAGPHVGLPVLHNALKDKPAIEQPVNDGSPKDIYNSLTDTSPKDSIKEKGSQTKKEDVKDEDAK